MSKVSTELKAHIRTLVEDCHEVGKYGDKEVFEFVSEKLDERFFNTHETAYQDIRNYVEEVNAE